MSGWCAECGQRHVPAERYDMRGLVGDYTRQVVSKLKILRTLWTLCRHPGRATGDFMAGRRIGQVNPVWLFLFVWSTTITVSHFFLTPETAEALGDVPPELAESIRALQPWFLGILAYTTPLWGLLVAVVSLRIWVTSRWIEAWVFALHNGTVGLLVSAPAAVMMARVGLWSGSSWMASVLAFALTAVIALYEILAYRTVFASRMRRPVLTFLAYYIPAMLLGFAWSILMGIGLLIVIIALQL